MFPPWQVIPADQCLTPQEERAMSLTAAAAAAGQSSAAPRHPTKKQHDGEK